ncbi:hypothetical protein FAM09_18360 [Niastella caeni]|uniref:Uncharacterized protein n=1 Tax=Niastella caeni TaxID=2569763 RepID=A0A4S8HNM1_9BACT|nr:hypothetical protein [Niastella caeni]THU36927.1 hypothetical protein FAM09_18360 [Niastella caeni]
MKRILLFVFMLSCINGFGQVTSQIQAKRGVFMDRLFLKDRWIDRISTNLNSDDSTNNNVLATGNALKLATDNLIQNQFSAAQSANFMIQGSAVFGSHNSFKNTLASGYPAQVSVTHGASQYGLSVQRSSNDLGPADVELFKNRASDFNTLGPLQFGDPIGSINFSGIAGDNSTVANTMSIYGFVEKTAPAYLSSGFIFNTTDSIGVNARRMGLNALGNLMIGNATTNPYKLNVVSGDVRFNSLAGEGYVLTGCDNNGVFNKVYVGENLYIEEGTLNAVSANQDKPYGEYIAILSQSGTNDPVVRVLENSDPNDIVWTRDSTGSYTGYREYGFSGGYNWFHSNPSDPTGNVAATRLYKTSAHTVRLVVKDGTLTNKDGWSHITVEIRYYPAF